LPKKRLKKPFLPIFGNFERKLTFFFGRPFHRFPPSFNQLFHGGTDMKNYRINFIRHGITQANLEGLYVGRTDHELCTEGIRQLINLRENCLYPEVQRIYSSPLTRCVQTAGILYPDQDPVIVEGLVELDFGEFDGKSYQELSDREDFQLWMKDSYHNAPTGGESGEEFTFRLLAALRYIFNQMMEEGLTEVAVFTHGGVIMNLMYAMGLPQCPFGQFNARNGEGYSVVLTPQMWMRDNAFEICGSIPVPKDYTDGEGWTEDPCRSVPIPGEDLDSWDQE
jgi:alpha-ribazole phosphatase